MHNMTRTRRRVATTLSVVLFCSLSAHAGQSYYFVDIINSDVGFESAAGPALESTRELAFIAYQNGVQGLYRASMDTPVNDVDLIADSSGPISFFDFGDLNSAGVVASGVTFDNGTRVVQTWPGGVIVHSSGELESFGEPQINSSNGAVFCASYDGGGNAILSGSLGGYGVIFDDSGPYSSFGAPTWSGFAVIVGARLDSGGSVVISQNGAVFNTLADTTGMFGGPSIPIFGPIAANDSFDVAFLGKLDDFGSGIYRTTISSATNDVTTIADTSGPFFLFGNRPAISENATVAFRAFFTTDDGNSQGIFTGADIDNDAVIKLGDTLFGSTVIGLGLGRDGFNAFNELAFVYYLDNGRLGIAVAVPGKNPCPQDIDFSGSVDIFDLLTLLAAWGPCEGCPEDVTGDGVVNVLDLLEQLAAWGPCS